MGLPRGLRRTRAPPNDGTVTWDAGVAVGVREKKRASYTRMDLSISPIERFKDSP
jgi:hypothetical protein